MTPPPSPPRLSAKVFFRHPALPPSPPRYLLSPSLRGRCFRCFEKGHRAARCREPRRCLLCMRVVHPASRCRAPRAAHRASEPMASPDTAPRPRGVDAFLPYSHPPAGLPSWPSRVARVQVEHSHPCSTSEVLPRGLAGLFGGSAADYKVASFHSSSSAIFFPSWAIRESAIGRSPLGFEGIAFSFSDWVEAREEARGRLLHKAWIRLVNWPILCWNEGDVKAAVSSFGELWECDERRSS